MREDRFTSTEADAAAYERHHIEPDYGDDRPTRAELARDEADVDCLHLHQTDVGHELTLVSVWVCRDCGQVCEP